MKKNEFSANIYHSIAMNYDIQELVISSSHGDIKKLMKKEPEFVLLDDYKKLKKAYDILIGNDGNKNK
jgi:hypothetical protein